MSWIAWNESHTIMDAQSYHSRTAEDCVGIKYTGSLLYSSLAKNVYSHLFGLVYYRGSRTIVKHRCTMGGIP